MTDIPLDYRAGHAKVSPADRELADLYVRHTLVGDPDADAVIALLDSFPGNQRQAWIQAGIEGGPEAIPDAPELVRDFFREIEKIPVWFDPERALLGCQGFHRHSEMMLGAFVGAVLIEGFSTLISKSFSITGRLVDQGVRRLKQNNRHVLEIFMPGGLDRQGDGWKLSVRIRLVHAQVRSLLRRGEEWETAAWGVPISAAHVAYAAAAFSALLLKRAEMLGARLPEAEREAFMMIWRYSGHLMGVLPELLFTSEQDALRLQRVGALCEPPPSIESCQLANGLINAAPIVAGIEDEKSRKKLVRKIYRISRALIGDPLADSLRYPPASTFGILAAHRLSYRASSRLQSVFPFLARWRRFGQFKQLMDVSLYESKGLAYRMPGHLHAEKDSPP